MALFDTFTSKTNSAQTNTTVATDSYNRSFVNSRNDSNSNNLNIAVGSSADPFQAPGDAVQKTALYVAALLGVVGLAAYWLVSRNRT